MTELKTTTNTYWTNTQAYALAAVSLVLGVCGGMLIRRATNTDVAQVNAMQQAAASPAAVPNAASVPATPNVSAAQLQQTADVEAAPLLEKLKTEPGNADVLASLGNTYYDAKQYPAAISYYERSLKIRPADTSVRTDLGTAYWYNGEADAAIAQFQKSLTYEPTKADTLFNLGIVEMQGKSDAKAALAAWQKLLDSNPGYANKEKVLQLMAQVQNH